MRTSSFFYQTKLSIVNKICLGGMFIALGMILNQVVCVKEIPVIPFLKISLGAPAIIIISSLLLGPCFGGLIGGSIDFLGYLLFDAKSFPYFPQISLTYILLGIVPAFIFSFTKNIKNKKIMVGIEGFLLLFVSFLISLFLIFNDSIKLYGKVYSFDLWMKIIIVCGLFLLSFLILLFTFLMNRIYKRTLKNDLKVNEEDNKMLNPFQISFTCLICEILVMVLFGTLMKATAFGFDMYMAILVCQILTMFFNIPLNIVLISYILLITRNYYLK